MSKEFSRTRKIERKSWGPGPWDEEPDFYEWTTGAGYEAYAHRLDSGTWVGVIIAPLPPQTHASDSLAFYHTLREKRMRQFDHRIGLTSYSDIPGYGEYCLSMEHFQSPGPSSQEWNKGPYKSLKDIIQICENVAQDIFETLQSGDYVNYFLR